MTQKTMSCLWRALHFDSVRNLSRSRICECVQKISFFPYVFRVLSIQAPAWLNQIKSHCVSVIFQYLNLSKHVAFMEFALFEKIFLHSISYHLRSSIHYYHSGRFEDWHKPASYPTCKNILRNNTYVRRFIWYSSCLKNVYTRSNININPCLQFYLYYISRSGDTDKNLICFRVNMQIFKAV